MRGNEATRKKRLVDYVCFVGEAADDLSENEPPRIMARFPLQDHEDFPLPKNVASFCQPDGTTFLTSTQEPTSSTLDASTFVFTLTDKDSNVTRYAVCHNFYRLVQTPNDESNIYSRMSDLDDGGSEEQAEQQRQQWCFCLTSICLISHYQFFSNFKECALVLRRLVSGCNAKQNKHDLWTLLAPSEPSSTEGTRLPRGLKSVLKYREGIETWIHRLLDAPVPREGESRVELEISPLSSALIFALPDKDRFMLCDFPLHLPLELLGISNVLKVVVANSDLSPFSTLSPVAFSGSNLDPIGAESFGAKSRLLSSLIFHLELDATFVPSGVCLSNYPAVAAQHEWL